MTISVFPDLRAHVIGLFEAARTSVAPAQSDVAVVIERPKQAQYGDFSCNVAMQLAKTLKRNPHDIAVALIAAIPASPYLAKAEIAGAGFINLFIKPEVKRAIVPHVQSVGSEYGNAAASRNRKIQVEF